MHRVLSILVLVLGSQTGCDRADEPGDSRDGRLPAVTVVNYPLQYFAQRMVDDRMTVAYPGPADSDPAYWRPGPTAIAVFQQSDRIFLNGAGYARWVRYVTLPTSRMDRLEFRKDVNSCEFVSRLLFSKKFPKHAVNFYPGYN